MAAKRYAAGVIAHGHLVITAASLPRALARLQAAGYVVRFRAHAWTECAVLGPADHDRPAEAWLGRGPDEASALANALTAMLPSALARQLWTGDARALPEVAHAALADVRAVDAPSAPAHAGTAPCDPQPEDLGPADPAMEQQAIEPPVQAPVEPKPTKPVPSVKAAATALQPVSPGQIDVALQQLARLYAEVEETADFALLSPRMMQLQLLAWLASARDWQDRAADPHINEQVRGLAQRVGRLAKVYWPGPVVALRANARPEDCVEQIGGAARDWHEVYEAATALMTPRSGEDEYGWSDADKLGDAPGDPRSQLGEALGQLKKLVGDGDPDSPSAKQALEHKSPRAIGEELPKILRRLRWLRLRTEPEPWGRAMGMCRWLLLKVGRHVPAPVHDLADPSVRPGKTWSTENGFDAQRRDRKRLVGALPPTSQGADALVAWFRGAALVLDAPELAQILRDRADLVGGLDPQVVLDGKGNGTLRDRLRKVQRRLKETPPATGPESVSPPPEPTDVAEPIREPGPVDVARLLVQGKLAVVMSNRNDPHLQQQLSAGLGLQLEWVHIDQPSALDAVAQRVRNHSCDLVLGLTSFMSHAAERQVREACISAGVPFVRAGKGRLVGSALAILRDMGGRAAGGIAA